MQKKKIDIIIKGNLICKNRIGGRQIYTCSLQHLNDCFDYEDALVIDGNVRVDSFDSKELCVVVTEGISTKGGSDGCK